MKDLQQAIVSEVRNRIYAWTDNGQCRADNAARIQSLADYYPDAKWQRCTVHWYRNVLSVVPRGKMKKVAAMLKAIHAQEDKQAARDKAQAVVEKLETMKLYKAAEKVRDGIDETLS